MMKRVLGEWKVVVAGKKRHERKRRISDALRPCDIAVPVTPSMYR